MQQKRVQKMEPFSDQTEKPQGMWRSLSHGFNADVEAEGCPPGGPREEGDHLWKFY